MNRPCPNCGRPVKPTAHFCPYCGHPLHPASNPVVSAPARSGTQFMAASPRLLIREGAEPPREVPLSGGVLSIGRNPLANVPIGLPTNNNPVGIPTISQKHAEIVPLNDGYAIKDLNSKNGTFLRGKKLIPNQPVPLQDGDTIRIGDAYGNQVSLTFYSSAGPPASGGTRFLGQSHLTGQLPFTIGRDPSNRFCINAPVVSARHAEIVQPTPGGPYELVDLNSLNGTFVNGRRVRRVRLHDKDVIQIGPTQLVFSPAGLNGYTSAGSVRLDGRSLVKEVPPFDDLKGWLREWWRVRVRGQPPARNKVLLDHISLSVLPNQFVALVGGSGAGKSTLMDALNGARRVQKGQGEVLINGDDLYANFGAYRTDMGYVPQADILHTGLTVNRALTYTARLRLPPDLSPGDIQQRVDDVLQKVEMLDKKDLPIYKLSGGQKKRVSIASELLSEPSLLFLDEPTSGLDPGLDKKMMTTLSKIADSGKTVLLVTHATNNILACDRVAFLAHGRLVYFGPPDHAPPYFNAPDFATIYSQVETAQDAEREAARFAHSAEYHQYVEQPQAAIPRPVHSAGASVKSSRRFRPRDDVRQLDILARRYLDQIVGDGFSLAFRLTVMILIGAMLLLIAKEKSLVGDPAPEIARQLQTAHFYKVVTEAEKLLLMSALSIIMLGVFAAAYEIVKERPVYDRERMINLGISPYLASKVLVLFGFGLIQCLLLLVVLALKVALPGDGALGLPAPFEMYITLALAILSSICLGLLISALVKNSNSVVYMILVVLFVQIIFSGALFPLPDAAKPLSYLTQTRWAMEGLGASVNMDYLNKLSQSYIDTPLLPEDRRTFPAETTPNVNYDHSGQHLLGTWFVQLLFAAGFASLAGWVLRRQDVQ